MIAGLDDAAAVAALCQAMGSPWEVSGAAHLPEALVGEVPDAAFASAGKAATLIRLEGFAPSVAYRAEKLKALFAPLGEIAVLEEMASAAVWRAVRDAVGLRRRVRHPLWRVSVAPDRRAEDRRSARRPPRHPPFLRLVGRAHLDRGRTRMRRTAWPPAIRAAVAAAGGGHATLIRGSPVLRNVVPPFEPQPEALAALSRRLKAQFDPRGILNPGRMVAGV